MKELAAFRKLAVPALAAMLGFAAAARAEAPVAIELVLAVDTSVSVDGFEYGLQMRGIARAFRDPEIVALIGRLNGVAVTLFQWSSGAIDRRYAIPWRLLTGPASAAAFAAEVEGLARDPARAFTGIGRAIDHALRLLAENEYAGQRLRIDVSGDGYDNVGSLTAATRRRAAAMDVVINGLPILNAVADLDAYYRREVILGPGAFIEIAADFDDFAEAFLRKLRRELIPALSRNGDESEAFLRLARRE